VVLVEAGTIPKTSSGKLQRSACRRMFESGELTEKPDPIDLRPAASPSR
jgi:hypothetical protein